MKTFRTALMFLLSILVALVLVAGVTFLVGQTGTASADPPIPIQPGSARGSFATRSELTNQVYTSSATSANTVGFQPTYWYQADTFLTFASFSNTAVITVTPQFSADNVNWANAHYTYILSNTVTNGTYQLVQTGDGTSYFQFPLAGVYTRYHLDLEIAALDRVTLTLKSVYKNTGGQ